MLLLPRKQIAELILAEMPAVRLPTLVAANQYACPKLSYVRGKLAKQWFGFKHAYGLTPQLIAGRPVCDAVSKGYNFLLAANLLVTRAAWQNGVDTAVACFDFRVLLEAGVDYLGIMSPTGGGHATGLMVVEDDVTEPDKPRPAVHHIEMQTGFDCPVRESIALGLFPVQLHD